MQNPFDGDNNEGPNGLPVPPNYATVTKADNGDIRIGKVGFSFTAFIFDFWVPIFRGDWYNFFCIAGIELGVGMGFYSIHFTNIQVQASWYSMVELALKLLWGFWYNYMYFRHLFNRGYQPATQRSKDVLANKGYLPKWLK